MVKKELTQLEQIKMLLEEEEKIQKAIETFMKNINVDDPDAGEILLFVMTHLQKKIKKSV